jgi:hypothetical protein
MHRHAFGLIVPLPSLFHLLFVPGCPLPNISRSDPSSAECQVKFRAQHKWIVWSNTFLFGLTLGESIPVVHPCKSRLAFTQGRTPSTKPPELRYGESYLLSAYVTVPVALAVFQQTTTILRLIAKDFAPVIGYGHVCCSSVDGTACSRDWLGSQDQPITSGHAVSRLYSKLLDFCALPLGLSSYSSILGCPMPKDPSIPPASSERLLNPSVRRTRMA